MQLTNIPAKFNIPFASSAGGGFIRSIPQTPTGVPGQAALTTGFPPENFEPVAAGGVPPFGEDFNGLLNQITAWNRWQGAGVAFPPYDSTFQTAVGGYPKSAIVASLIEPLLLYYSLVDNNLTNPDNGGAGWFIWSRRLIVNTTIYVNAATGNDSNNGLTPGTAKATIQAAVTTAWSYPPSQFTITIQIADGTYNEAILTPSSPGPSVILNGNSTTPSNVLIAGVSTGPSTVVVTGPNTMTVQNLKFQTGVFASSPPAGLVAQGSGSNLFTQNTISGVCASNAIEAFLGGTVFLGDHNVAGNCGESAYAAIINGVLFFNPNQTTTISAAVTMQSFVSALNSGAIAVRQSPFTASFVNPGNVTGQKYIADLNGVVNTVAQGINYFPGNSAGALTRGGQYA